MYGMLFHGNTAHLNETKSAHTRVHKQVHKLYTTNIHIISGHRVFVQPVDYDLRSRSKGTKWKKNSKAENANPAVRNLKADLKGDDEGAISGADAGPHLATFVQKHSIDVLIGLHAVKAGPQLFSHTHTQ